jgi:hypothetical protein
LKRKLADFENDEQVGEAAESGDHVLGDTIAEEVVAVIVRQIPERQHRDGRKANQPIGAGEAGDLDWPHLRAGSEPVQWQCDMERPGKEARNDGCSHADHGELPTPSAAPCDGGRGRDLVNPHWLGNVLHTMAAERAVPECQLVPDLLVDGVRNADGTGSGEAFQPGRNVDAVAEDVVAIHNDVAEIDTNPQLKAALRYNPFVGTAGRPLHFDGTAQRVNDAGKLGQHTVAGGPNDAPAICHDERIDGAAEPPERLMRARLILPHKPAEPHHVGVQDGRKLPLPGWRCFWSRCQASGFSGRADLFDLMASVVSIFIVAVAGQIGVRPSVGAGGTHGQGVVTRTQDECGAAGRYCGVGADIGCPRR